MLDYHRVLCVFLAVIFFLGPNFGDWGMHSTHAQPTDPPRTSQSLSSLVDSLMSVVSDPTDSDLDGLPDSIEAVIGTDPNNDDSDFDRLDDLWETDNDLDPLEPDSNYDGLGDYLEVTNVNSLDVDGDGLANAWDFDNDGDGVNDNFDLSPFARSVVHEKFYFDITNNGNPVYIDFQIKPENSEHLKLYGRDWDWPDGDNEGSMKDLDNSKEDVVLFPLLKLTVNEAPDQNDVKNNGIAIDGNDVSVPLFPITEHGTVVAFAGRMLYPVSCPTNLIIDAKLIWKVIGFNDPNSSVLNQETLLVTYEEDFMLSGVSVEEFCGSSAGVFYSSDPNQTVAANLLLAYDFLRDSETHVSDMPAALDANDINVSSELGTFAHRDEALVWLASEAIPEALDSLPPDKELPVVTILEDQSAGVELSEFQVVGGSGNSFSLDLTTEQIKTSKTLKTPWYDTSTRKPLSTGEVMSEIQEMELTEEASYTFESLMLYWNTGEQKLYGLGDPPTKSSEDFDMVSETIEKIVAGSLIGLEGLYRARVGLAGLKAYRSIKFFQSKGWSVYRGGKVVGDISKMSRYKKFKTWVKQCDQAADSTKLFKHMNKALEGLSIAAVLADAGFAVHSVVAISQTNNLSGLELNTALLETTMEYYYSCTLFMIGAIPYVGWLIALSIELSDMFGDWSDDVFEFFIDSMSNVNHTVSPEIDIVGDPEMKIYDNDENGLDVGDRIEYKSRLKGTALGNAHYWSLVYRSNVWPYYSMFAPSGSNSTVDYLYSNVFVTALGNKELPIPHYNQWDRIQDQSAGLKSDEYEAGAWIEPGMGMVNFPVRLRVDSYCKLWYEWEHFVFLVFYGFWCYHDSYQANIYTGDSFTVYFDVMPGNIDDLASWSGITMLDHDGDGLADANEVEISNPWRYDSDGDGLNDKYEVDNGLDPQKHDTDGDGLIDWFEIQYGADGTNPDTDGDGLGDYLEISGWLIEFDYSGETFVIRVHSDPTIKDTDSDGVDDYDEYLSGLNPRSSDTNGDGTGDVANPINVELELDEDYYLGLFLDTEWNILDIGVDFTGNLYVLQPWMDDVWLSAYDLNSDNIFSRQADGNTRLIAINNDYLYELYYNWYNGYTEIRKYVLGGSLIETLQLSTSQYGRPFDLETDSSGNIYLARWQSYPSDNRDIKTEIYDPNGILVGEFGSYGDGIDELLGISGIEIDTNNHFAYMADLGDENIPDDKRITKWQSTNEFDYSYITDLPTFQTGSLGFGWGDVVTVDSEGYAYVADLGNDRVLMYDLNGDFKDSEQHSYPDNTQLVHIKSDPSGCNIYLAASYWDVDYNSYGVVQKFKKVSGPNIVAAVVDDSDSDGLADETETTGWDITFTDPNGEHTVHVTSDPLLPDTDLDGLADPNEYAMGTNPRNPDTDNDGLSDYAEWRGFSPQTNPRHFDTDGDGLPDGIEINYGSNPNMPDTDQDGLSDLEEFGLGSNPRSGDTDKDGVSDLQERAFNSSLFQPDTDGDFMFDAKEFELGTDPNSVDTDNDGLVDGDEIIHDTDPLNGDTDGDNVPDGTEIDLNLNPLSEDTDGDGIPDGIELERGTNPLNEDSDQDGIPDNEDTDSDRPHVDDLVLLHDPDQDISGFIDGLSEHTDVEIVPSVNKLLSQYTDEPRIVLVGRPDGSGPVGTLINDLLADAGDVLTDMIESDKDRLAVRYGVWNNTQTIVMLSSPYPSDHLRVLDILRRKTVTIVPDSARVRYHLSNAAAYPSGGSSNHDELLYNFFAVDEIDTVKQTDSILFAKLTESVDPNVEMNRYDNTTVPFTLTQSSGLADFEIAVGRYVEITLSENVQSQTGDIIDEASIRMYYKESDLDRTGDGTADDPEDINETTLAMYCFDESAGQWTKLSEDLDWVFEIGADTTDVQLYGNSYAGYVWASVSHLSLYGLAGQTFIEPLETSVHIIPQAINRDNHLKRIMAIMQVPQEISRNDIVGGAFELYVNGLDGEHIEAIRHRVNGRGRRVKVFAMFNKDELMQLVPHKGHVELTVVGRLETGQYIYGNDKVKIIEKKWHKWWKFFSKKTKKGKSK